jgi:ferredoxin
MPKITFVNEHRIVEVDKGRSVRDVALELGIDLNVSPFYGVDCGGHGLCATCMCWVDEGAVPGAAGPKSFMERLRQVRGWRRLACCTKIEGDLKVFSFPGGDERVRKQRPVSPPPSPVKDPTAARKPLDAASTTAFPYGYPSAVGSGTRKPPEKAAVPASSAGAAEAEEPEEEASE